MNTKFQLYINSLSDKIKEQIYKKALISNTSYYRIIGICYLFSFLPFDIIFSIVISYIDSEKRPWSYFYNSRHYVINDCPEDFKYTNILDKLNSETLKKQNNEIDYTPFVSTTLYENIQQDFMSQKASFVAVRGGDIGFDYYILIEYIVKNKHNYFTEIKSLIKSISATAFDQEEVFNIDIHKDINAYNSLLIYPHKQNDNQYWISIDILCNPIPLISIQFSHYKIEYRFTKDVKPIKYKYGILTCTTEQRSCLAQNYIIMGSFKSTKMYIYHGWMLSINYIPPNCYPELIHPAIKHASVQKNTIMNNNNNDDAIYKLIDPYQPLENGKKILSLMYNY